LKIETSITINRPITEVLDYVTQVENTARWTKSTVEAIQTSDGPIGAGSTCRVVSQAMGRRFTHEFEVTDYQPGVRYAVNSTDGPFPVSMVYTVDETDKGTKLHVVSKADLGGLMSMAGPLVRRMAQKQIETDHRNLKRVLESSTSG
jgi:carbon monoxide dehydrogenase subunit G